MCWEGWMKIDWWEERERERERERGEWWVRYRDKEKKTETEIGIKSKILLVRNDGTKVYWNVFVFVCVSECVRNRQKHAESQI